MLRLGGLRFKASLAREFMRPHVNKQLGTVVCAYHPKLQKPKNERIIVVPVKPRQTNKLVKKKNIYIYIYIHIYMYMYIS
jgi:hypothetical protein